MPPGLSKIVDQRSDLGANPPSAPVLAAFSLLASLAGVWLIAVVVLPQLAHSSRDYSLPVQAQVVESRFEAGSKRSWNEARSVFSYRYFHQGRLFRSSAYRPGGYLDEAVRAHPPGSMLTAYLDPDQPEYAMVWPGMARDQLKTLMVGLLLLVVGVGMSRQVTNYTKPRGL